MIPYLTYVEKLLSSPPNFIIETNHLLSTTKSQVVLSEQLVECEMKHATP
jgi:hypothetical protein